MPRLMTEMIVFKGLDAIGDAEKPILAQLSTKYYGTIKRALKNLTKIEVHIKVHNKEGKRKKYSVHVKAISPTKKVYVSSKAHDWDFARAVHKSFQDIQNEIKKSAHTDVTMKPRKDVY